MTDADEPETWPVYWDGKVVGELDADGTIRITDARFKALIRAQRRLTLLPE